MMMVLSTIKMISEGLIEADLMAVLGAVRRGLLNPVDGGLIVLNVWKYPTEQRHALQDWNPQQYRCENHPKTLAGVLLAFSHLGSCVRSQ